MLGWIKRRISSRKSTVPSEEDNESLSEVNTKQLKIDIKHKQKNNEETVKKVCLNF